MVLGIYLFWWPSSALSDLPQKVCREQEWKDTMDG